MSHAASALTTPTNAVDIDDTTKPSARTPKRRNALMGALPFIGVILFAIDAVPMIAGNRPGDWRSVLFDSAVTNMIGWAGIGAAVSHIVFGKKTSRSIGWATSPYEFEVGLASLAMGVAGLMAGGQPLAFAWSLIIVNAIYRVGCGVGHIRDIVRRGNLAANNTTILIINFAVPAFLIWAYHAWA